MLIGILSDTHISKDIVKLRTFLNLHLPKIDMLIHAGDFTSQSAEYTLSSFKDFRGVCGNCDDAILSNRLKEKEILYIEGYSIGICHGFGKKKSIDNALYNFKDENIDILVFGHSHQPLIQTIGKILVLNPGSPFYKRKERWFSFITLEVTKDVLKAQLNLLPKPEL